MRRRRWKALGFMVVVCGVLLGTAPAEALPITGGIRFGGAVEPIDDFQTINAIDIVSDAAIVLCTPIMPCTGAFAGLDLGIAEYNDFSFNPLGGNITPLWSFAGFSFNLTNIAAIQRSEGGIVLQGFGTLFGNGFDPTMATWSFSVDRTGIFGFSSTTSGSPVAVPDSGSTLMLLGAGMLALAFARARFGLH